MKLWSWLKNHWDLSLLLLILTILCLRNFTPSTYLIGWDNLLPELNIWLNLKRSFLATCQEYQGLGLVGGMAHATDLIRQIILLPFILILPNNLIRYFWHFSMIFIGTLGVFFISKNHFKFSRPIPFFSALFYLLNFGTIQNFWNPLETFSTFWGFFPWLIYSILKYLRVPTRKNLLILALINLLSIPAFYVQTLFIVYLTCVFLMIFSWLLYQISARSHNARSISVSTANLVNNRITKILLTIFFINSFWLFNQFYFLSSNLKQPTLGIGNFMSNDQTFQRNQSRGYLSDFLLLRGYYYDFPDSSGQMMAPWIIHFSNNYTLIPGYLIALIVIIGMFYLLTRPKQLNSSRLLLILLLLLSSIALLSATPPFAQINSLIRQLPLINQIFRSPFTKFVVPAAFTFSLLFAFGLHAISRLIIKLRYSSKILFILYPIFFLFLVIFSFPSFMGNFISAKMRTKIPSEYFDLFSYFHKLPSTARIANLPQGSYWGWTNYHWGYTGSGFLWYGIPQPILDRAFDAWNLNNEQYYWELTTALQENNVQSLSNIFQKYSIQYLIFDQNVYYPDDQIYAKNYLSLRSTLSQIPKLKLSKEFGKIQVFEYQNPTSPYLLSTPVVVKPFSFINSDVLFTNSGDYVTDQHSAISLPYIDLFTNRLQTELTFSIGYSGNNLNLTSHGVSTTIPIDYSVDKNFTFSPLTNNQSQIIDNQNGSHFHLTNHHNSDLFAINFPDASLRNSYLVRIDSRHISGHPLEVSAVSNNSQNKYFDTFLSDNSDWTTNWFLVPARETDDFNSGLNFIFNNASYSYSSTVNEIKSVTLYPIPYSELIRIGLPSISPSLRHYLTSTSSIFLYQISLPQNSSNQTLVFPQSYAPGWLAFYFNGLRPILLQNHVLVNNWANGWSIPSEIRDLKSEIYILFWPQLLQFLGFGLLIGTFILILRHK